MISNLLFVTKDATLNYHHRMFMHVFMGGPDPDTEEHDLQPTTTEDTTNVFHVLVSKLQESLNRKESFEVVTPYQGPVDGELFHPMTLKPDMNFLQTNSFAAL